MTTFEALSLVANLGIFIIATLTLIVTIVVLLNEKSNRPPLTKSGDYFFGN